MQTVFSDCQQYRYCLWRAWGNDPANYYLVFIGLNPSTADETRDDPTTRRCVRYAQHWGYDALCLVNLFAYRAVHPAELKKCPDPIGIENDHWIAKCTQTAPLIIAAWGTHGTYLQRDRAIKTWLNGKLYCLGLTKYGHPRHPLYTPLARGLCPLAQKS
ncbi:MAG: DUF1643 domain-containing protein [Pseudanabaenaceae cyanobacterium]